MILDGQNCFSSISVGDSPTAMTDNASTNTISQSVNGLPIFRGEGGAYVAPFVIVKVSHDTPFTTGVVRYYSGGSTGREGNFLYVRHPD